MNEVNSDGISRSLTHLPLPHFSTLLYRTRSGIPTRINSNSSFTSRLLFQSVNMIHIEHRHRYRSRMFWVYSHDRKTHWCIESTSDLPLKSHSRLRLDSLLLQRSCDIVSNLNGVLVPSFVWRCRFDFLTMDEESVKINLMHCSVMFFWRGQNTKLTSAGKIHLIWSSSIRTSSVVGAPPGRHSRLDPVFCRVSFSASI